MVRTYNHTDLPFCDPNEVIAALIIMSKNPEIDCRVQSIRDVPLKNLSLTKITSTEAHCNVKDNVSPLIKNRFHQVLFDALLDKHHIKDLSYKEDMIKTYSKLGFLPSSLGQGLEKNIIEKILNETIEKQTPIIQEEFNNYFEVDCSK